MKPRDAIKFLLDVGYSPRGDQLYGAAAVHVRRAVEKAREHNGRD